MSFLIPMAIALIAAYIRYQVHEEIVSIFATLIALLSLILSFVLAPWIVQILILVGGLAGVRYFCDRHSCQQSLADPPPTQTPGQRARQPRTWRKPAR